ncbi:hypothetical protein BH11PSE4_BH11PSE4_29370 [soil metagenome]
MLHRDIFWLGSQWAVTGFGVQAVSNKFGMQFDIEASRLFEDGLDERMRSESWFDAADFSAALDVARRLSRERPTTFRAPLSDER